MVQTEATKQGFCTRSSEEDFRPGREIDQQRASAGELGMIGAAAQPGWAGSALGGRVGLERQVPEQFKSPESGTQCCE